MVDNFSKIQQMLAESRFAEVQKEVELILLHSKSSVTKELLEIYFESLKAQSHVLPIELVLTFIEQLLPSNPDEAEKWIDELKVLPTKYEQKKRIVKIEIAELKGRTQLLYNLIQEFQLIQFELQIPKIPTNIVNFVNKYFTTDFQMRLQSLAFDLLRKDLVSSELAIKALILSCFERSSPKGTKAKLQSLYGLLNSSGSISQLEIYKNLCQLFSNGIETKKDYKKLIELVLYVEDFELQAVLLKLMVKEKLQDIAEIYADCIKANKNYSYVYFDKYFSELKPLLFKRSENKIEAEEPNEITSDLSVGTQPSYPFYHEILSEISDEEILVAHLIKHQDFSSSDLLEIATSFVQSEFYYAALQASDLAYNSSSDTKLKLKASYLKIISLLKRGDCRAALDISMEALSLSESQNDILSFLYSQTEAHLRLKEYAPAKKVLERILSIDSSYRMAKERLDRLNAI
jgi:hypothetical protein